MTQAQILADQLERVFRGGAWHGPSLAEALEEVDAATAAARPLAAAHSIWEIVHHLTTWTEVPRRRLAGEAIESLPAEEDWRPVSDPSPAAWERARGELDAAYRALHAAVVALDDARLADPVAGSDPTVRGLLLGVLQHSAYHAGQIVLLRKGSGQPEERG